jgi:hypothetical protein
MPPRRGFIAKFPPASHLCFFDVTDCSVGLWRSAPHGRVLRVQC